jgi:hypothetical protein
MAEQDFDNCTIQDYAVMVEGLPTDPSICTKQDVVTFFSTKFSPHEVLSRRKLVQIKQGVFDKSMDRSALGNKKTFKKEGMPFSLFFFVPQRTWHSMRYLGQYNT